MNYRHAFHAGNHADVLKHAVLTAALGRLRLKSKPFAVIDAFAGSGRYDLMLDDRAQRTGEWRTGVGPLLSAAARFSAETQAALAPYLAALREGAHEGAPRWCPGSPLLAAGMLRAGDKLHAVERHPEEAGALRRVLAGAAAQGAAVKVHEADGWESLRAFTPPTPRRGLALVDPPFEAPGEFGRVAEAAEALLARWATGVQLLWTPIKDLPARAAYLERVAAAAAAAGRGAAALELWVKPEGAAGLLGSTVVVVNPPFGLLEAAAQFGPELAAALSPAEAAGWRLTVLAAAP